MAKSLPAKTVGTAVAEKWFRMGVSEAVLAKKAFRDTAERMLTAGMYFRLARESLKEGDFGDFIQCFSADISRASVYRYIELVENALNWATKAAPKLSADPSALFSYCKTMVLQSPREMVAIWRSEGLMRKFGEYDAVRYRTKKLLGGAQLELDFSRVFTALSPLEHLDDPGVVFRAPEGQSEQAALTELKSKLEAILTKINAALSPVTTV